MRTDNNAGFYENFLQVLLAVRVTYCLTALHAVSFFSQEVITRKVQYDCVSFGACMQAWRLAANEADLTIKRTTVGHGQETLQQGYSQAPGFSALLE